MGAGPGAGVCGVGELVWREALEGWSSPKVSLARRVSRVGLIAWAHGSALWTSAIRICLAFYMTLQTDEQPPFPIREHKKKRQ